MTLNIKSAEADALARELTRVTGESLTTAVIIALRERLTAVRAQPSRVREQAEALLAIGRDTAARLAGTPAERDHGELLYDERGLPR